MEASHDDIVKAAGRVSVESGFWPSSEATWLGYLTVLAERPVVVVRMGPREQTGKVRTTKVPALFAVGDKCWVQDDMTGRFFEAVAVSKTGQQWELVLPTLANMRLS